MISNPIFERELKERARTVRMPVVLSIFLLLFGCAVWIIVASLTSDAGRVFGATLTGRNLFHWILFFLLLFVSFITAPYASGMIAGERERQTLHLVQMSGMTPRQIVTGKIMASLAWVTLLVVATLPFAAISVILGGVTWTEMVVGYAMVLFCAATFSTLCIGLSSRMKRSSGAAVLSIMLVLVFWVGTWAVFGLAVWAQDDFSPQVRPTWALTLNPLVGTASAIQGRDQGGTDEPNVMRALFFFVHTSKDPSLGFPFALPGQGANPPAPGTRTVPFWVWTAGWYLLLDLLAFRWAVVGVTTPRATFVAGGRRRRRGQLEEAS
ncbi:MAG TPA: ABC transporter permease subunit [Actinomycetota bacterium]